MDQICDNCRQSVKGLIKVAGHDDLYMYEKNWCFACVYEKALSDTKSRKKTQ